MQNIYLTCDVCKTRKLNDAEAAGHLQSLMAFMQANPAVNRASLSEHFCTQCLPFAHEYWLEKQRVLEEAAKVFSNRIENHRSEFFRKRILKLRAVK